MVENLLARFGDVDAIFSANESSTFGCLQALQDHGLAGKVIHIGFDSEKKLHEALATPEIIDVLLQDPRLLPLLPRQAPGGVGPMETVSWPYRPASIHQNPPARAGSV
jgi:hypothetical protein